MIDCPIGGESPAGEGRGMGWVEIAERHEVVVVGDRHALGIAAVLEQAGLGRIWADHLLSRGAGPAVRLAAAPAGVDENRAERWMHAGDLVSENHRQHRCVVAIGRVEI